MLDEEAAIREAELREQEARQKGHEKGSQEANEVKKLYGKYYY